MENVRANTLLEVRLRNRQGIVKQSTLIKGMQAKCRVPNDSTLETRELSLITGKPIGNRRWQSIFRPLKATKKKPTKRPGAKRTPKLPAMPVTKKRKKKKPAKRKANKAAKKKAPAKTKKKKITRRYKCSICGKTVKDLFTHRWKYHKAEQEKSLKKAQRTRKKNAKKRK